MSIILLWGCRVLIRKHYVTLSTHNNTEVTYQIISKSDIRVTFEQAVSRGFNTLVLDEKCNIVSRDGFSNAEVGYYQRFLERNLPVIRGIEEDA